MKPASLADIKRELKSRDHDTVLQLCLRLGRFKKDNKELLSYMLFESDDEVAFISSVKEDIEEQMTELNMNTLYYAKKGLRRVIRNMDKNIRYSGIKETEIEIRLHLCQSMKKMPLNIIRSTTVINIYDRQIVKIQKALNGLHEDLQADYTYELEKL